MNLFHRALLTALLGTLFLSGCTNLPWSSEPDLVIRGEVYYLERIALPRDAVVHVALVTLTEAGQPGTSLREVDILPGHQPPIPFTLRAPGAVFQAPGRHGVYAEIRDHRGAKQWVTPAPAPITNEPMQLRVKRVEAPLEP